MFRRLTIAWLAMLALQMPGTSARAQDALQKRALPPLSAAACQQIAASAGSFAVQTTPHDPVVCTENLIRID